MHWLPILLICIQSLSLARGNNDRFRNFGTLSDNPSTVDTDGTLDGRLDLRAYQVLSSTVPLFVNSWYYLFWITLEDGRQCMAITNIATVDNLSCGLRSGLLNLATKKFSGQGLRGAYAADTDKLNVRGPNLTISSPAPDNYSVMSIASNVGGARFNLTVKPQGKNFYHGGMGIWNEGSGLTTEYANPDLTVEGVVELDGEWVKVDKHRSVSWYDRQFGLGQAPLGWELFWLYLSNGVRISAWHTRPQGEIKRNVATVWYPSGRHQIVSINNDTHASGAYNSKYNNITYHTAWKLEIEDPPASFDMKTVTQDNEMVNLSNLKFVFDALWEGYVEGEGYFDGEDVTFYGNVEQFYGAAAFLAAQL